MPSLSRRTRALALCSVPVAALLATAALAPLPYVLAEPGMTADVLGEDHGRQIISVSGHDTRDTSGRLLMTTITATSPDAAVRLPDVLSAWFRTDRAAMPADVVYPEGESQKEIEEYNQEQMTKSQDDATAAALSQLRLRPDDVDVTLHLAEVGGPSAGLMFTLGIVDKIDGDGSGGDLTGGRTIAGTGTIEPDGTVGPVGGVPLKTQAAKRDGATVFLVPEAECAAARAELPEGLRLVPVGELDDALESLKALRTGGTVPAC
ncbi:S16 family serine protease [Streptomyces thermolineatus]|uniref:S16 family serine protease n=1 Tax=Streptomyces thermolineatus TaxID=44033 RepID=UPI00384F8065